MKMDNHYSFDWLEYKSLDGVDSTNDQVHALVSDKEILLVSAEFQRKGRGQKGNSWESGEGQNLLFSLLIRPDYVASNEQFILSQAVSLAIQQTLSDLLKTDDVKIKWPNDIYWKDRKICGILIENSLFGKHIDYSTIGVGLNVNQCAFLSDAPNPVSLFQITGQTYERTSILMEIVKRFHDYLKLLKAGKKETIIEAYSMHLYRKDGFYPYRDSSGEFRAKITGIEPLGHLILTDDEGRVRKYAFKEVAMVLPSAIL